VSVRAEGPEVYAAIDEVVEAGVGSADVMSGGRLALGSAGSGCAALYGMDVAALLLDLYCRVPPLVADVVDGLDAEQLSWRPGPAANPIGWLVWHLTRVQDVHVSEILDAEQLWASGTFAAEFGLEADRSFHGYGHTSAQVAMVRPGTARPLLDYFGAVHGRTAELFTTLTAHDLDRVVDRSWDPPVTLGVRLISVADDCLEHAGQAAYVRGLLLS
jgi:hypothetical protein